MSISTHVLDAVTGTPAAGLAVLLEGPLVPEAAGPAGPVGRSEAVTDADGRIPEFGLPELVEGTYRLTFRTAAWFLSTGRETFYPEIVVTFSYTGAGHVHVPILLSPFSYTTYRGS